MKEQTGIFALSDREASDDSLQVCIDKWQGAEADPLQLQELVDMEVSRGLASPRPFH